MSENMTHCHYRPKGNCPICQNVSPQYLAATVNNVIAKALRDSGNDAELIANLWGWSPFMEWSTAQTLEGVTLLDKDISVMCVSEYDLDIEKGGVKSRIIDYSIGNPGPSEITRKTLQGAKENGHNVYAKIQTNNSWECSAAPYLPLFDLTYHHIENLRAIGVEDYMLTWTLGGYPSPTLGMISEFCELGETFSLENWYDKTFGENKEAVHRAVRFFCKGFQEFPFSIDSLYYSPKTLGCANLWDIQGEKLDVWKGELYLQFHRGTFTSIAEVKRNNRKAEFALMNLEFLCAWNAVRNGTTYPKERINRIWEKVLINQFHDILPGSSIEAQYDITRREYAEVFAELEEMTKEQEEILCKDMAGEYVVFNPHSFAVSDYVEIDGSYYHVENVPSKGVLSFTPCAIKERTATPYELENKYYQIKFNERYEMISVYDKINGKEVLVDGGIGNRLRAYVDIPHTNDAWEIQDYYKEKYYDVNDLLNVEFVSMGGKYGYKIQRRFRNSLIEQYICLYEEKEGIYFETTADWQEEHILLKAEFPVAITANTATFDIQFGNIERSTLYNTPWEKAAFEVCGHKYADYSQQDYGVALMNDCKYDYDIHGNTMSLSLIKCATDPNKNADKGKHVFTYALYPHRGGLRESKTIHLSYVLNNPLKGIKSYARKGEHSMSFARLDKENVILETIKKSEKGDGLILRLYESFGVETQINLHVEKVSRAYLCDMMEKEEKELSVENGTMRLTLKPYEILTVKCKE